MDGEHCSTPLVYHWTDREGLAAIMADMELYEDTSFTTSLDLPFDLHNGCIVAFAFSEADIQALGYKSRPSETRGISELEQRWELKGGGSVDFLQTPPLFLATRDERTASLVRRFLRMCFDLHEEVRVVGYHKARKAAGVNRW